MQKQHASFAGGLEICAWDRSGNAAGSACLMWLSGQEKFVRGRHLLSHVLQNTPEDVAVAALEDMFIGRPRIKILAAAFCKRRRHLLSLKNIPKRCAA